MCILRGGVKLYSVGSTFLWWECWSWPSVAPMDQSTDHVLATTATAVTVSWVTGTLPRPPLNTGHPGCWVRFCSNIHIAQHIILFVALTQAPVLSASPKASYCVPHPSVFSFTGEHPGALQTNGGRRGGGGVSPVKAMMGPFLLLFMLLLLSHAPC